MNFGDLVRKCGWEKGLKATSWLVAKQDDYKDDKPTISAHPKRSKCRTKSRTKNKRKMIQMSRRENR